MRIMLLGDSLSLPRWKVSFAKSADLELEVPFEQTYPVLLHRALEDLYPERDVFVINRAKRACEIGHIFEELGDHMYTYQPDLIVLQTGLVDCLPRKERGGRQKVPIEPFADFYGRILTDVHHKPDVKLAVLGICPGSERVYARLPGFEAAIAQYNEVLARGADGREVFFVDMARHFDPRAPERYHALDDQHLNRAGHRLFFSELLPLAQSLVENRSGCAAYADDPKRAHAHFVRALKAYPANLSALYNALFSAFELGDRDGVVEWRARAQAERHGDRALDALVGAVAALPATSTSRSATT